MIPVRSLSVFLLLLPLVMQGESNEKIYETYFNGYCYWSEEIAYHVHYLSGCKIYFTCQHGKFLDFHRCPESTVFNIETRKCVPDGICQPRKISNPSYEAWWERVVSKIDDVVEALKNSTVNQSETSATTPGKVSQMEVDSFIEVLSTPTVPTPILQTKSPSAESTISSDESFTFDWENLARETRSLPSAIESSSEGTKKLDVSSSESILPSPSVTDSFEINQTSIDMIPMQFDSLTSFLVDNFSSTVAPLHEDIIKVLEQFGLPPLEEIISSNSTGETDIMQDFILPLVQDILQNATIMAKMNQLFDVLFQTADPLLYRILDQRVSEKKGIMTQITVHELKDALNRTILAIRPVFKELLRYLHPVLFKRVAESGDIIFDYFDRRETSLRDSIQTIFGELISLEFKYFFFSDTEYVGRILVFSLADIREDIKKLFKTLSKVLKGKAD